MLGVTQNDVNVCSEHVEILVRFLDVIRDVVYEIQSNADKPDRISSRFYVYLDSIARILAYELSEYQSSGSPDLPTTELAKVITRLSAILKNAIAESETNVAVSEIRKLQLFDELWTSTTLDLSARTEALQLVTFGNGNQKRLLLQELQSFCDKLNALNRQNLGSYKALDDGIGSVTPLLEPYYQIGNALQSVYDALCTNIDCDCSIKHENLARVELSTFQKYLTQASDLDFDLVLNSGTNWNEWKETVVHVRSPSIDGNHGNNEVNQSRYQRQKGLPGRRQIPKQRIQALCKLIQVSLGHTSRRLSLELDNDQLYKILSTQALQFQSVHLNQALSLSQLIDSHEKGLGEKVKRVLAVVLAYAVFHLFGSSWVSDAWTKDEIYFAVCQGRTPLRPFLHRKLKKPSVLSERSIDQQEEYHADVDPDNFPLHPYPELVALGTILLEIFFGKSIEELAEDCNHQIEENVNAQWFAATSVFKQLQGLMSDRYSDAVDSCLNPNFGDDVLDSVPEEDYTKYLKTIMYYEIVRKLETELEDGFGGSIAVATLDVVAPEIDIGPHKASPVLITDETPRRDKCEGVKVLRQLATNPVIDPAIVDKAPEVMNDPTDVPSFTSIRQISNNDAAESNFPTRRDFHIAIICALEIEADAIHAIFDDFWDARLPIYKPAAGDWNSYTLGSIGAHNVCLAYMPGMGKANASAVAANIRTTFPCISLALVVGVCGGVPYDQAQKRSIYLGDLIVSTALVQYDFGRQYPGTFKSKDTLEDQLGRPGHKIRNELARLKTKRYRRRLETEIMATLETMRIQNPETVYPGAELDKLYEPTYLHLHRGSALHSKEIACTCKDGHACKTAERASCEDIGCEPAKLVTRTRVKNEPVVHFGKMASGDAVMKSGTHRDALALDKGVIAFEMEGAGVHEHFPSIVIKSVCDYADCHKSKFWQIYAATVAATGTKAILREWPVEDTYIV